MSDDDDLFASLGGSLMRDILADLQADDDESNWLSLEQLEQELSKLESPALFNSADQEKTQEPFSAASMVVERAALHHSTPQPPLPEQPIDAWSLSLQRFTHSSLEQDFLKADSVRKEQYQVAPAPVKPPPGLDWSMAEDYDVSAPMMTRAPPGLVGAGDGAHDTDPQQLLTEAAIKLMQQLQQCSPSEQPAEQAPMASPPPFPTRPPPVTPQNSVVAVTDTQRGIVPPTPPPSAPATPAQLRVLVSSSSQAAPLATMPEHAAVHEPTAFRPEGAPMTQPPSTSGMPMAPPPTAPSMIPVGVPIVVVPSPHGVPMPPQMPVPMAGGHPAWQVPPAPHPHMQPFMSPPPQRLPLRVFCNPHPRAPPIPAAALASNCMSARDISYVVHSIMKPLLTAGVLPSDYDIQYFMRQSGAATGAPVGGGDGAKKDEEWVEQMQSRSQKSKEWSSSNAVLGHVAKSNVARPRALISTQAAATTAASDGDQQRQRASLWRARIYCDQAYQAYFQVLGNWRGSTPASSQVVQAHYRKLFKCLGISPVVATANEDSSSSEGKENRYQVVDKTPLQLLLKLEKGRVLIARILEQAVLPPNAMQTLLPALLDVLMSLPPPSSSPSTQQAVDDRVFLALTRVIQTLPNLDTLQDSMKAVTQQYALVSTFRMQSVHALLQRGSAEKSRMSEAEQEQWNEAEADFMKLLSGV